MEFAILLIEKDQSERRRIRKLLGELPYSIKVIDEQELDAGRPRIDIVIAGISEPDEEELQKLKTTLARARSLCLQAQTILCAPSSAKDLDRISFELRARSFIFKPIDPEGFTALLEKTLSPIHKRRTRDQYVRSARRVSLIKEIIGRSEAIGNVLALLEKVSESSNTSVLLLGESGTGKSLFAQTIHEMSDRSTGPFIEINCAALPASLMESELFGHERGAFTDAKNEKVGLIELADGGTLFLDEIAEVQVQTQAKLLKFFDSKKIRRVGGGKDIHVDVRVIAASNRDLREEVRERRFRQDLFYRLNVVEITIPPLRERKEDIEMIASFYLDYYKKKFKKPYLSFSSDALELIRRYPWPGNVRELINVIERTVLLCQNASIRKDDLPLRKRTDPHIVTLTMGYGDFVVKIPPEGIRLEALEKKVIEETLRLAGGNVLRASRMLGISRGAMRYKLAKYRIEPRTFQKMLAAASRKS